MITIQTQTGLVEGRDYLLGRAHTRFRYIGGAFQFVRFADVTMDVIATTSLENIDADSGGRILNGSQSIGEAFIYSSGFPFLDKRKGKRVFDGLSEKLLEEPK